VALQVSRVLLMPDEVAPLPGIESTLVAVVVEDMPDRLLTAEEQRSVDRLLEHARARSAPVFLISESTLSPPALRNRADRLFLLKATHAKLKRTKEAWKIPIPISAFVAVQNLNNGEAMLWRRGSERLDGVSFSRVTPRSRARR